jgi:hypothetical protein
MIMEIEINYYKKLYKSTNPDNEKLKKYIENTKVQNKLNNNETAFSRFFISFFLLFDTFLQ